MSPFLMIKGCIVNNPKNCTRVYLVHHGLGTENPHFHFAVWQGVRKLTIFSAIQDESTRGMTFRREDIICAGQHFPSTSARPFFLASLLIVATKHHSAIGQDFHAAVFILSTKP